MDGDISKCLLMEKGGLTLKVLVALDSFKGSISSIEGGKAVVEGILPVFPDADIVALPLADGGEGTVDALVHATNGRYIKIPVIGPLHEKVLAAYGILGDGQTAVIEVAAACGLTLVPPAKRNPLSTTTYGVGELILDAIEKGCRKFIIGLGGSATNDGGLGMLQALGYRFLDKRNQSVGVDGKSLKHIERIVINHVHPKLRDCEFDIACDVHNPLYGPNGAAYIFGPQKGANQEMVEELDEGLRHFGMVIEQQLGLNISDISGAGAAGGLGGAFAGFLNGQLRSGTQLILDVLQIENHLQSADFVITGEGRLDSQTAMGKAPYGIAELASKYQVPVIALAGAISTDSSALNNLGITSYFSIMNEPMSLEQAMDCNKAYENLTFTSNQLFRLIKAVLFKEG